MSSSPARSFRRHQAKKNAQAQVQGQQPPAGAVSIEQAVKFLLEQYRIHEIHLVNFMVATEAMAQLLIEKGVFTKEEFDETCKKVAASIAPKKDANAVTHVTPAPEATTAEETMTPTEPDAADTPTEATPNEEPTPTVAAEEIAGEHRVEEAGVIEGGTIEGSSVEVSGNTSMLDGVQSVTFDGGEIK